MTPPRVLVLSHMYPRDSYPIGGIFVHEQVKALRQQGNVVAVLSGEPFWISTRKPRRIIKGLRAWQEQPLRWCQHDGVPVMYFPYCVGGVFRNFVHAISYLQAALRVIDTARARFPFDIIHAHTSFLDGYTAVQLGKRYGCPVVLTEHMGPFSVLTRNVAMRYFTGVAVRKADRVLAVSQALRNDMIAELGAVAERAEVLGNGVDPTIYFPAHPTAPEIPQCLDEPKGQADEELIDFSGSTQRPTPERMRQTRSARARMLWVGHVSAVKGVDRLIRALARANVQGAEVDLTLMGGGELDGVRELADTIGMGPHVTFLPAGERPDVAAAMWAHDFLVVSSHKETFSLVALEALACGRPVLTTACGGPEDFVIDGENGLIVPNSEEGLSEGVVRMAKTHNDFDIGTLAGKIAKTQSWEAVTGKLEAIYKYLADSVSSKTKDTQKANRASGPTPSASMPKRVLMISTDHLMIDRRILQEAMSLRDAGHQVEILAGFECPKPADYDLDGIHISRFVFDWNDTRAQRLLSFVKYRNNRSWPYLWRATRKALALVTGLTSFEHFVLRQIVTRRFDVLHVHDFPLLRVGIEVKKRLGSTLVYDAHELYHGQEILPGWVQRRYKRQEKRLIHAVDAAITVNPYIAGIMARDYNCKIPSVLLNAAPLAEENNRASSGLRARLKLPEAARIVLYQGWMSPERGIDVLVRAAAHFPEGVHLVLVGYGDCEPQLKAISREQGTDDGRVIFMGRMEPDELAELTWEADLGVIPYRPVDLNHLYCSPNKLFEFAVAGVPFLANDLPFLRDIADEYGFGLVADMNVPEALAEAVCSIFEEPDRLATLKSAARKAGLRLNWDVEGQKLLEIYARLPEGIHNI